MTAEGTLPAEHLSVLHVFAPGAVGGLESVVRALAAGLAGRGHRVGVLAVLDEDTAPPPLLEALETGGVEVKRLVLPARAYGRERRLTRRFLLEFRPGLVHTHGYRPDVVAAGTARGLGFPTVTTVHGFTGGGWRNRLYEHLQLRAFRRFDAVVAVSRQLVERITAGRVRRERVSLIPNALPPNASLHERLEARQALGLPPDGFVVGWVGRLSREKGMDVMIDALRFLGDIPLTLVVIGDGRERATLEARAASLGVEAKIRWLGTVPDAARFFRAFDVFVLSSRTEGTPVTLLEAMAAGVAVVATAVGGVPDVVSRREGWLAPAEMPGELAGAIRQAWVEPSERATRTEAAGRRLAAQFAVDPWLEKYETVYRALRPAPRKD